MGKKVRAVKKPRKKISKLRKENSAQYRATLVTMAKMMRDINLRDEHITELRKTPFWHLFNAFLKKRVRHERKFDSISTRIIQLYRPKEKKFRIGSHLIPLNATDISLIFGIMAGKETIKLGYSTKEMTPFVKRRFTDTRRLDGKIIKDTILEISEGTSTDDIQDLVRLLCLYLLVTLLFATTGFTIRWGFVKYIEDIDEMCKYGWSEAICSTLLGTLEKANNNPKLVTGCVIALQYWLCEHTSIVNPLSGCYLPRFVKWDLIQLNKKLKNTEISNLNDAQVHPGALKLTLKERKIYGCLLRKYLQVVVDKSDDSNDSSGTDGDDEASEGPTQNSNDEEQSKEASDEDTEASSNEQSEDSDDEAPRSQETGLDRAVNFASEYDDDDQKVSGRGDGTDFNSMPNSPNVEIATENDFQQRYTTDNTEYSPMRLELSDERPRKDDFPSFNLGSFNLDDVSLSHDKTIENPIQTPYSTAKSRNESSKEYQQEEKGMIEDLVKEIEDLKMAKRDDKNVMAVLKQTIEDLKEKSKQNAANEELKLRIDVLVAENKSIRKAKADADQSIAKIKQDYSLLSIDKKCIEAKIDCLQGIIKIRDEEMENLRVIFESHSEPMNQEGSANDALSEKNQYIQFLHEQFDRIKNREMGNKMAIADMMKEKEFEIRSLNDEVKRLATENAQLHDQIMIQHVDNVVMELNESMINELRSELESLKAENAKLKEKGVIFEVNKVAEDIQISAREPHDKDQDEVVQMNDTKMTVEKKKMGTKGKKKPPTPRSKRKRTQMTIQEQWQSSLVRGVQAKLRKRKRMAEYFYTPKK